MLPDSPDGGFASADVLGGFTADAPAGEAGETPGLSDSCHATPGGGGADGGYRDNRGNPCDPTAAVPGDAGAGARTDGASTDAAVVGDAPSVDCGRTHGDAGDAGDGDAAGDGASGCQDATAEGDRPEVTVGEGVR